MFGIGYQEMFVILVVALVIFGPSRLPELAGQVGRWVRDFRRMSADLTGEFEKTFAEVDEVKRTIKREMQSIQDEVEGVGKSARGDLKRSTGKTTTGAKKPLGALKSGTGTGAASARDTARRGAGGSKRGSSNGARAKVATDTRQRAGRAARLGGTGAVAELPVATKEDPLADVSFFDLDLDVSAPPNGAIASTNGSAGEEDEALVRVRRRRAAAAYGRRNPD